MHRLAVLLLGIGCTGAPAPTPPPAPVAPRTTPQPPRYVVVPAELGDQDVIARAPHRAIVRRFARATLRRDDDTTAIRHPAPGDEPPIAMVVIGETATHLRVVAEDDKARLAAWIARDDAALTVLAATWIGTADGATGIQLAPGVALEGGTPRGDHRSITVLDPTVRITATAPAARLGHVWTVAAGEPAARSMKAYDLVRATMPSEDDARVLLAAGAQVRSGPDGNAPVIATVVDEHAVALRSNRPGWIEVELTRPRLRVRGFVVDASMIGPAEGWSTGFTGSGHGVGRSHAVKHQVPAGTCLFDRADGEVVGVAIADMTRYGSPLVDGWAEFGLGTPWSTASLQLRNTATDPSAPPVWASCARDQGH